MGYRGGFLGLLHMEIVQERLEREFDLDLITTAPTVVYRLEHPDGRIEVLDNPAKFPTERRRETTALEPYIKADIHVPNELNDVK